MKGHPHLSYRPDIDGLRALAIIPVVIFHAFPHLLRGGFVGVDVFFVISGYLISSIILKDIENRSFSFLDFYTRRINRIFPALLLVLLSCLVFGWFALYPDEYMQLGKHAAGGAGFVANIVLAHESGYFDTASHTKVLLHLWSLGVEEQFYLLWPVLILLFRNSRTMLLLLVTVFSLGASIYYVRVDPVVAFYSPITRFWELAVGAALAFTKVDFSQTIRLNKLKDAVSIIGFLIVICSIVFLSKNHFPGYKALLPVIGSAMIIAAGKNAIVNRRLLSSKTFVFIGLISYPLYLWHWPIITYARIVNSEQVADLFMLCCIVASFVLAIATWKLWESPIRMSVNRCRNALFLLIAVSFLGLSGAGIYLSKGSIVSNKIKMNQNINAQFIGSEWPFFTNETCLKRYPYENSSSLRWWFCVQNKPKKPEIMLLGTSYANHFYPGFIANNKLGHKTIVSIGTCDPALIDNSNFTGNHPCAKNRPRQQEDFIKKIISEEKSIRYVVLAGLNPQPSVAYEKKLTDFIAFLIEKNIKPMVFVPHVPPRFDTKSCFARPFATAVKSCRIPRPDNAMFDNMINNITSTYETVRVFDQNNVYCNATECNFIKDGMPMFRDVGHYSLYGSKMVSDYFVEWAKIHEPDILK